MFSSESVDRERDIISTTGDPWSIINTTNLFNNDSSPTVAVGSGGSTVAFSDGSGGGTSGGDPSLGSWDTATSLPVTGGVINWSYELLSPAGGGANMVGFYSTNFAPVPEPSAALLGFAGAAGLLFRRRRAA